MPRKKRPEIKLTKEQEESLRSLSKSRTESAATVMRSKIIILYSQGDRIAHIARELNTNRPLIERCIDKALSLGPLEALDDLPRSGRPVKITDDAKSWLLSIACQKPTELGYAAETWTYSALIKHVRRECENAGYDCFSKLGKGMLNKILSSSNIKPHKIGYYLERRDPDFEEKMANVLCVYKEISLINDGQMERKNETTISYDEKPGIQATMNIAPQLSPVPNKHPNIGRDYEYKRLGTLSLLAAIDLHTGRVIPLVKERHRSREFIEFLEIVDQEYPDDWTVRIVLDNHSSHISKETQKYLKTKPGRFEFIFTPKHGSWLNMIEMFFSKIARSFLRHIRVESKEELKERILLGIKEINQDPVVFKWKYKMTETSLV